MASALFWIPETCARFSVDPIYAITLDIPDSSCSTSSRFSYSTHPPAWSSSRISPLRSAVKSGERSASRFQPSATSGIIIGIKPGENAIVPAFECLPSDISSGHSGMETRCHRIGIFHLRQFFLSTCIFLSNCSQYSRSKKIARGIFLKAIFFNEFTGCKSCSACKIKNSKTNGVCAIRDSIRPLRQGGRQAVHQARYTAFLISDKHELNRC